VGVLQGAAGKELDAVTAENILGFFAPILVTVNCSSGGEMRSLGSFAMVRDPA
jgi:hypothetical protein